MVILALVAALAGCVQTAPPELMQAVEDLDQELALARGVEFAPEEYIRFAQHWVAFKDRLNDEEESIRWPWESNPLALELEQLRQEGAQAIQAAATRREAERRQAEDRVLHLERRLQTFTATVDTVGGRMLLGQKPVKTELLVKQARSFFSQGHFSRSVVASDQATQLMLDQTAVLGKALGRYADVGRIETWRKMVARAVNWSRLHRAVAIVVSKAERRLTVYRNGRAVKTYPVRLGYNGALEKRHQGDGATPEGQYRIIRKRDHGQTKFYRALLLDYPNEEDRRRFRKARMARTIPAGITIGGQIEIHGSDNEALSATLGCIMLDNPQMDDLFAVTEVGTPVTIVGALDTANPVALALGDLEWSDEETDQSAVQAQEMPDTGGTPNPSETERS